MNATKYEAWKHHRRHLRVRTKVQGTPARPRLAIYRSLRHIYAQVIDDVSKKTLLAISTLTPEIKKSIKTGGNKDAAKAVGKAIGERCKEKGITQVAFDRGGFRYHGRVAAVADAAREAGLKF